jgi:hypothetical protein
MLWVIPGPAWRALHALVDAMTNRIRGGIISPVVSLKLVCHSQIPVAGDGGLRPTDDRLACLSRSVTSLAR